MKNKKSSPDEDDSKLNKNSPPERGGPGDDEIEIDFGHFANNPPGVPEDTIPPDNFIASRTPEEIEESEHHDFSVVAVSPNEENDVANSVIEMPVPKTVVAASREGSRETVEDFGLVEIEEMPEKTTEIKLTEEDEALEPPALPSLAWKSADQGLMNSESLQLAQKKIQALEKENEALHGENIELSSAAQTLKNRADSMEQKALNAEMKYRDLHDSIGDEKNILLSSVADKDGAMNSLNEKVQELEAKLQNSLKKVRVRERELENRLELVKMEGKALLISKDDMILNLKRQLDQIQIELEGSRSKIGDSQKIITHKQEVIRRTVKTLRLALSLLETEDLPDTSRLKKAE